MRESLEAPRQERPPPPVHVLLFPEAAFPADTLAASENRSGLYLKSNGIFDMVLTVFHHRRPRPSYHSPPDIARHVRLW